MNSLLIAAKSARTNARSLAGARGATAVEYALMLVMILLIVFAAFNALGNKVKDKVKASETALTAT